jgi:plastocyanin
MRRIHLLNLSFTIALLAGCSGANRNTPQAETKESPAPVYFKVDPATAGVVSGTIKYTGKRPARKPIDMSGDPACVEAHHVRAYDESEAVNAKGELANVFVYIKSGLEGKTFETPAAPVAFDQKGCWFNPRVIGLQAGQTLQVSNSDPVTHNIHPLAEVNREWNHSQGPGDAPIARKFPRPEVMIRVKCNIHSWMRAYIGVLEHPYFAVSAADGSFEIRNVPPGDYTIAAWQETLGTQDQKVTVPPSGVITASFTFRGE